MWAGSRSRYFTFSLLLMFLFVLFFNQPYVPRTARSSPAGLVVLGMFGFYWGEALVQQVHSDWDSVLTQTLLYTPSILHIVYTNMLATVYRTVAKFLTEFGKDMVQTTLFQFSIQWDNVTTWW